MIIESASQELARDFRRALLRLETLIPVFTTEFETTLDGETHTLITSLSTLIVPIRNRLDGHTLAAKDVGGNGRNADPQQREEP